MGTKQKNGAASARKPRRQGEQSLKLRGVYMGLLNGVSLKNKAKAKRLRQEKGTARAIGFLREVRAD